MAGTPASLIFLFGEGFWDGVESVPTEIDFLAMRETRTAAGCGQSRDGSLNGGMMPNPREIFLPADLQRFRTHGAEKSEVWIAE